MRRLPSSLVNLLFPTRCVICGTLGAQPLCTSCLDGLPFIRSPICARCGQPTPAHVESCSSCLGKSLAYAHCRSLMVFEESGREVIHALKYANGRGLAPVLAAAAVERLEPGFFDVDAVVFVPLHPSKRSERGYNQSELVARAISRATGVPVTPVLRQIRSTADQARLNAEERQRNVSGAYEVRASSRRWSPRGRALLLLDDVFTTGATVGECSRALVRAGATDVRVMTLARAPLC